MTSRYRRIIMWSCAVLLVLAGLPLAEFYVGAATELIFPNPPPQYSLMPELDFVIVIFNMDLFGMFIGHLALLGLAGIALAPLAGQGKRDKWLLGLSWLGLLSVGLMAVVTIVSVLMDHPSPEEWTFAAALAAYALAGATLITLRLLTTADKEGIGDDGGLHQFG